MPSVGFRSRPLDIETIQAGNEWLRLYSSQFLDPLGFGYRSSRFSDPRMGVADEDRYAVVYLGSTLKVCFLEAVLRDQGNGRVGDWLIEYAELEAWTCAKVRVTEPLRLVDLRGDGAVRMGIPSDVPRGTGHALSQTWSAAIWSHDMRPDGIIYPSRLNGEANIAMYDRALSKLTAQATPRLLDCRTELADALRALAIAIV